MKNEKWLERVGALLLAVMGLACLVCVLCLNLTGKNNLENSLNVKWFEFGFKNVKKEGTKEKQNGKKQVAAAVAGNKSQIYDREQLSDFSMFYQLFIVDEDTYVNENEFDLAELAGRNLTLKQDNSKPQILIYHSHSQEQFADSSENGKSIVDVGEVLKEHLTARGYSVIHDTSVYDLVGGVLDRNRAYDFSRQGVLAILQEHPSIEVIIDLHRDGVREDMHLATEIDGKKTAKIMLFNGMSRLKSEGELDGIYNPYLTDNLALSLQIKLAAMKYYPDFCRANYINAYKYNLDLRPRSLLIEAGAQTNTYEEEANAMEPLAELLQVVLQ